jgi:hypothetical protein
MNFSSSSYVTQCVLLIQTTIFNEDVQKINHTKRENLGFLKLQMGTAVAQWLRYCSTNQKVAGLILDGVMEFFILIYPSDRTMVLGSTQPLTEMSTGCIFWGQMRPVRKADNLTTILCRCQ